MTQRFIAICCCALVSLSIGCGDTGECPDLEPEHLEIAEGQELLRVDDPENPTAPPFVEEETYIRIISPSEVEIIYEKDGETIVQTYEVTDRSTNTGWI